MGGQKVFTARVGERSLRATWWQECLTFCAVEAVTGIRSQKGGKFGRVEVRVALKSRAQREATSFLYHRVVGND